MTNDRSNETRKADHEPASLSASIAMLCIVGFLLLITVSFVVVWAYQSLLSPGPQQKREVSTETERTAESANLRAPLEADQRTRRLRYEAQQRQRLHSYAWTDERRKTARIPIDRAMKIVQHRYQSQKRTESRKNKP